MTLQAGRTMISFNSDQLLLDTAYMPVAEIDRSAAWFKQIGSTFAVGQDDLDEYEIALGRSASGDRLALLHYAHAPSDKITLLLSDDFDLRDGVAGVVATIAKEMGLPVSAFAWTEEASSGDRAALEGAQEETIVAVYDTAEHAAAAVRDLLADGIPQSAISQHGSQDVMEAPSSTDQIALPRREEGFWSRLFGGEPEHDRAVYDRSVAGGSTVVTVRVSDAHVDRAIDILDMHAPIDLEERAASYGMTQTQTTGVAAAAYAPTVPVGGVAATATDTRLAGASDTIRLAEERLTVGKRLVNQGGTRIRRYVVATPVEEQVSLHSEKVTIERRPVTDGRAVSGAAFTEKTIQMTEMAEEVLVAKTAVVTEEISLQKQATERVETIRDTVRKEEVEIENLPADRTTTRGGIASTNLSSTRSL